MNKLYLGDNLEVLRSIEENSIDLIYIDPPFLVGKNFKLKDGTFGFSDIWKTSESYYNFLYERICLIYKVLKSTGSFWLHCDKRTNSVLRLMLDEIFSPQNFKNEVIWHYTGGLNCKKKIPNKHDSIFWYTKSDKYTFNQIRIPYKETSGYFKSGGIVNNGKKYQPNPEGKIIDDVWEIPIINPMSKERNGWPTQKPEKLLERIIKIGTNEGDLVADFFCGSGTTLKVVEDLGRNWIGSDISEKAIEIVKQRVKTNFIKEKI